MNQLLIIFFILLSFSANAEEILLKCEMKISRSENGRPETTFIDKFQLIVSDNGKNRTSIMKRGGRNDVHLTIFSQEETKKSKYDGYKVDDNSNDKQLEFKQQERSSDFKALTIITINRMTGYITYSNNYLDNKKSGFIDNGLGTCLKIDAPKKKF